MKKSFSPLYIESEEIVTLPEEELRRAEVTELDLDTILRLVDLMFLFQDDYKVIPS